MNTIFKTIVLMNMFMNILSISPKRGFSFLREGPIDMRFDQSSGNSAGDWLASVSENTLAKIIKEYKMNNPLPNNYDCPICNKNEEQILEETGSYQHSSVNRSLFNVDHDHKTGKVRGWICTYCNNMLARSRDNPETLRNGAKYLEENNG